MPDVIGSIIGGYKSKPNSTVQGAGAIIAFGEDKIKKPEENPLSNANLAGGIFTHPNVRMS